MGGLQVEWGFQEWPSTDDVGSPVVLREPVGGTYQALEMFNFFFDETDLLDASKSTVKQVSVSWGRVAGCLRWMEVGDRPGQMIFHAGGIKMKRKGFPDFLKREIEAHSPMYRKPPPLDDARPTETSWTYFKKVLDKRRKELNQGNGRGSMISLILYHVLNFNRRKKIMHRMKTLFLIGAVALMALSAVAMQEPGVLARTFSVKPKAGMAQQFEAALKQHISWARQQNETWVWNTWQDETGERFGQYIIRSPGHHWADFDAHAEMDAKLRAHWYANVAQYVESVTSAIVASRPDVSRWPEGETPAFVSVFQLHLKSGRSRQFNYAIKKIHDATKKSNRPRYHAWLNVVSGGQIPTSILVIPHKNWAAMKRQSKPLWALMEEVYGRQEAQRLRRSLAKTVRSETRVLARYRPDLSLQQAGQ